MSLKLSRYFYFILFLITIFTFQNCSIGVLSTSQSVDDNNTDYSPLLVYKFNNDGTDPDTISAYSGWAHRTVYDNQFSHTGTGSLKITFQHLVTAYGFTKDLPVAVGAGETIWYRMYLYLPSTLSLSHGDTQGDGTEWKKLMVLSPEGHNGPRMYLQNSSLYKLNYGDTNFTGNPGVFVNHDGLGNYCYMSYSPTTGFNFPRDQWFALQMAWQIRTDNTAFVRAWADDVFLGECSGGGMIPNGYSVKNFGIGDYWNGGAWIQNASTASFWIDNIVISTETPTTLDSGGRPYIRPQDFR